MNRHRWMTEAEALTRERQRSTEPCRNENAIVEAEFSAGNLYMALSEWSAELRILEAE